MCMSDEHIQRFELCFKIKIPSINLQGGENIGAAFNGTMLASCFLSLFDVLLLFEPLCLWVNKGCPFMSILLCYLLCRYCSSDDVSYVHDNAYLDSDFVPLMNICSVNQPA